MCWRSAVAMVVRCWELVSSQVMNSGATACPSAADAVAAGSRVAHCWAIAARAAGASPRSVRRLSMARRGASLRAATVVPVPRGTGVSFPGSQ